MGSRLTKQRARNIREVVCRRAPYLYLPCPSTLWFSKSRKHKLWIYKLKSLEESQKYHSIEKSWGCEEHYEWCLAFQVLTKKDGRAERVCTKPHWTSPVWGDGLPSVAPQLWNGKLTRSHGNPCKDGLLAVRPVAGLGYQCAYHIY